MSYRWYDNRDVTQLTNDEIEELFCEDTCQTAFVLELHDEWRQAWSGRTDQWREANHENARLAKRTSELTAQIEQLTEELYQVKHGKNL